MLKSHQPPITVEKQVENLETLGCTVENKEEAIEFLNNVSYFRLIKAYGFGLKERNANYNEGVTFNKIKGLYLFILNQMIISKNPQFTGISARQQLEFTTHLLLTD